MNTHDSEPFKVSSGWRKVWFIVAIVASIAGAISIITPIREFFGWTKGLANVDLDATFPNETWKPAKEKDFSWIEGEWTFPALDGFLSRFKIEDDKLYRQNEGSVPQKFKTEWVEVKPYISNNRTLRLAYPSKSGWDDNFFERIKEFDCKEHERSVMDDGAVVAGDRRLMLSRGHCKISLDGTTYDCK